MQRPEDREVIEEVAEILKDHRGASQSIPASSINNSIQIDVSDTYSRTRRVIKYLLYEEGMSIGADNSGYYLIKTSEELLDNIERLDDRIFGMELRKKAIRMAYHGESLSDADLAEFVDYS